MPLSRLVGRERELDELRGRLPTTRLLTLTGAGGSGKTRLALELAARCGTDTPDGVGWVELAPLAEASLIPGEIATALGLRPEAGCSVLDTVIAALAPRQVLLVLDNCEHLVDACAQLVETLLQAAPGLRVLTTTREALGLAGESTYLVPLLSLPDPEAEATLEAVAAAEAVELFVERARAVAPGFALDAGNAAAVAEVCRRLDGIPLAIELAAARIKVLTPREIASRLADLFSLLTTGGRTALPRHKTLRGTIDWSHALLGDEERILFRRLGVFADSFDLGAAEAVAAGGEVPPEAVLDGLTGLVDKSLVIAKEIGGATRYRLLETVRQYALERLAEGGESEDLRRRHATHYLAFAEVAERPLFGGPANLAGLQRLLVELGNLRAADAWFHEAPEPERIAGSMRIGAALIWFWFAAGAFREGRRRLEAALERSGPEPAAVRARALNAWAYLLFWHAEYEASRPPYEEAITLLRQTDDRFSLAFALGGLGGTACLEGDTEASHRLTGEALAIVRTLEPTPLNGLVLYWHGLSAQARGENALARASFEEAVAVGRALAHSPCIAHPLYVLGRHLLLTGEVERARDCLLESLTLHAQNRDMWGGAVALECLAQVALAEQRHERALLLLGAAGTIRETLATPVPLWERDALAALVTECDRELGEEESAAARQRGRTMTTEAAIAYALGEAPALDTAAPTAAAAPRPAGIAEVPAPAAALRVLALGPLEVLRGDEPVPTGAFESARARELLVYLLCRPQGASKEEIGLALWPDASPEQLRNSFHVTLHRLRRALGGGDWVVLEGDRYRVNPAFPHQLDADLFERQVGEALGRLASHQRGPAAEELAAALALYRGDFLAGETGGGDWHLEHRERLAGLFRRGLTALGDTLVADGDTAAATEAYQRLLAHDPTDEEAGRRLMICLARQGQRSQALRLYRQLADDLARELDAEPDDDTAELYERLQNAERV